MRHHEVWQACVATMEADSAIVAAMTVPGETMPRIYMNGERKFEVPSLTGFLIVDFEQERWDSCDFQFDIYTRTASALLVVERRLRYHFHRELRVEISGLKMWATLIEGRSFFGPEDDKFFRRSLDFRFKPIRSRYVRV